MAHRKFVVETDDEQGEAKEPITFDIAHVEGIACRDDVNGKLLMDLIAMVDSNSVGLQTKGIVKIFDISVLPDDGENPDDYAGEVLAAEDLQSRRATGDVRTNGYDPTSSMGRLKDVLDDPAVPIKMEQLAELVGWLVEQYTGRPTQNVGSSGNGSTSTNRTSPANRRLPAGGRAKSQRVSSSTSSTESTPAS